MDILYYILILICVTLICCGGIYIKKRFKLSKDDMNFAEMILEVLNYINNQYNNKYAKDKIQVVIEYAFQAIDLVEKFTDTISFEDKKKLVIEETKIIMAKNNIAVNEEVSGVINTIISYIMMNFDIPKELNKFTGIQ